MDENNGTFSGLAAAGLLCLLTAVFFGISSRYPFYLMWDMDLTVAQDAVLIQSGLLPVHLAHPAFGVYLLLVLTQKLAYAVHGLAVLDLEDLSMALNPLACMAELTVFFRRHSPILILGTILSLRASLQLAFPKAKEGFMGLLLVAVLGTQASFFYQAAFIRSELFAVFYWSLALLFCAWSLAAAAPGSRSWLLLAAGVFLGLSCLTKVQAVFYALALPVLYGFLRQGRQDSRLRAPGALSLGSFVCFLALLWGASRVRIPEGFAVFASRYLVNPEAVLFGGILFLAFLLQRRFQDKPETLFWSRAASLMGAGMLLGFLLHLLLYPSIASGWRYLLFDFKVLFMRASFHTQIYATLLGYPRMLLSDLSFNPLLYPLNLLWAALLWRRSSRQERLLIALLVLLAYGGMALATRAMVRDLLWRQTLVTVLTLAFLLKYGQKAGSCRGWKLAGTCVLLVAGNLGEIPAVLARLDHSSRFYGWDEDRWFSAVYGGSQRLYEQALLKAYEGDSRQAARRTAVEHQAMLSAVRFVFPRQRMTLRQVGLMSAGARVWTAEPAWRIETFPAGLKEAWIVDHAGLGNQPPSFMDTGDDLGRRWFGGGPDRDEGIIYVRERRDLRVTLFADPQEGAAALSAKPTADRVLLSDGRARKLLAGFGVKDASRIDPGRLPGGFFFAVRRG